VDENVPRWLEQQGLFANLLLEHSSSTQDLIAQHVLLRIGCLATGEQGVTDGCFQREMDRLKANFASKVAMWKAETEVIRKRVLAARGGAALLKRLWSTLELSENKMYLAEQSAAEATNRNLNSAMSALRKLRSWKRGMRAASRPASRRTVLLKGVTLRLPAANGKKETASAKAAREEATRKKDQAGRDKLLAFINVHMPAVMVRSFIAKVPQLAALQRELESRMSSLASGSRPPRAQPIHLNAGLDTEAQGHREGRPKRQHKAPAWYKDGATAEDLRAAGLQDSDTEEQRQQGDSGSEYDPDVVTDEDQDQGEDEDQDEDGTEGTAARPATKKQYTPAQLLLETQLQRLHDDVCEVMDVKQELLLQALLANRVFDFVFCLFEMSVNSKARALRVELDPEKAQLEVQSLWKTFKEAGMHNFALKVLPWLPGFELLHLLPNTEIKRALATALSCIETNAQEGECVGEFVLHERWGRLRPARGGLKQFDSGPGAERAIRDFCKATPWCALLLNYRQHVSEHGDGENQPPHSHRTGVPFSSEQLGSVLLARAPLREGGHYTPARPQPSNLAMLIPGRLLLSLVGHNKAVCDAFEESRRSLARELCSLAEELPWVSPMQLFHSNALRHAELKGSAVGRGFFPTILAFLPRVDARLLIEQLQNMDFDAQRLACIQTQDVNDGHQARSLAELDNSFLGDHADKLSERRRRDRLEKLCSIEVVGLLCLPLAYHTLDVTATEKNFAFNSSANRALLFDSTKHEEVLQTAAAAAVAEALETGSAASTALPMPQLPYTLPLPRGQLLLGNDRGLELVWNAVRLLQANNDILEHLLSPLRDVQHEPHMRYRTFLCRLHALRLDAMRKACIPSHGRGNIFPPHSATAATVSQVLSSVSCCLTRVGEQLEGYLVHVLASEHVPTSATSFEELCPMQQIACVEGLFLALYRLSLRPWPPAYVRGQQMVTLNPHRANCATIINEHFIRRRDGSVTSVPLISVCHDGKETFANLPDPYCDGVQHADAGKRVLLAIHQDRLLALYGHQCAEVASAALDNAGYWRSQRAQSEASRAGPRAAADGPASAAGKSGSVPVVVPLPALGYYIHLLQPYVSVLAPFGSEMYASVKVTSDSIKCAPGAAPATATVRAQFEGDIAALLRLAEERERMDLQHQGLRVMTLHSCVPGSNADSDPFAASVQACCQNLRLPYQPLARRSVSIARRTGAKPQQQQLSKKKPTPVSRNSASAQGAAPVFATSSAAFKAQRDSLCTAISAERLSLLCKEWAAGASALHLQLRLVDDAIVTGASAWSTHGILTALLEGTAELLQADNLLLSFEIHTLALFSLPANRFGVGSVKNRPGAAAVGRGSATALGNDGDDSSRLTSGTPGHVGLPAGLQPHQHQTAAAVAGTMDTEDDQPPGGGGIGGHVDVAPSSTAANAEAEALDYKSYFRSLGSWDGPELKAQRNELYEQSRAHNQVAGVHHKVSAAWLGAAPCFFDVTGEMAFSPTTGYSSEFNRALQTTRVGGFANIIEWHAATAENTAQEAANEHLSTRICPRCNTRVEPGQNINRCPSCGFVLHRDLWAAAGVATATTAPLFSLLSGRTSTQLALEAAWAACERAGQATAAMSMVLAIEKADFEFVKSKDRAEQPARRDESSIPAVPAKPAGLPGLCRILGKLRENLRRLNRKKTAEELERSQVHAQRSLRLLFQQHEFILRPLLELHEMAIVLEAFFDTCTEQGQNLVEDAGQPASFAPAPPPPPPPPPPAEASAGEDERQQIELAAATHQPGPPPPLASKAAFIAMATLCKQRLEAVHQALAMHSLKFQALQDTILNMFHDHLQNATASAALIRKILRCWGMGMGAAAAAPEDNHKALMEALVDCSFPESGRRTTSRVRLRAMPLTLELALMSQANRPGRAAHVPAPQSLATTGTDFMMTNAGDDAEGALPSDATAAVDERPRGRPRSSTRGRGVGGRDASESPSPPPQKRDRRTTGEAAAAAAPRRNRGGRRLRAPDTQPLSGVADGGEEHSEGPPPKRHNGKGTAQDLTSQSRGRPPEPA
jgi:hypothetical protein